MERRIRNSVALVLAAVLVTAVMVCPAGAEVLLYEEEPTAGAMVADFIFVRPFAILGLGVSTVCFGLSYPFSYWGNNEDQAVERMVVDPFDYAFRRPLGDF
ncbi:MAG: hypothetical protein ACOWWM_18845 [Desulfobacterales bacterium]